MAIDMKTVIAEGAMRLLVEKKVKKLTVKDITEECNITRQTFYYHFEDIPDLMRWIAEKMFDKIMSEILDKDDPESALRYMLSVAIDMHPNMERVMQSKYGDEIEKKVNEFVYRFSMELIEKNGMFKNYSIGERKFILRFYSQAIVGVVRGWTKEDMQHMDEIVHLIHLMLTGEVHPF